MDDRLICVRQHASRRQRTPSAAPARAG